MFVISVKCNLLYRALRKESGSDKIISKCSCHYTLYYEDEMAVALKYFVH